MDSGDVDLQIHPIVLAAVPRFDHQLLGIGDHGDRVLPRGERPGQAVALACSRIHPGDLQVAVIAEAIVDDHSHPHITHIKCTGIAETEVDLLISVRERLDGEITAERLNRLQWVKHQLLDASEAGVGVIVENMPPIGQVGAAAVQMQMIACLGHRHAPPFRLTVEEPAAIPLHRFAEIADRIAGLLWWQWRQAVVMESVVDARLGLASRV